MSTLNTFIRNLCVIRKDTEDHDRFKQYIMEILEDQGDVVYLITEGCEALQVPAYVENLTESRSWSITFDAHVIEGQAEIAGQLIEDTEMDMAGFLAMSGGRSIGNYLRAELLDGEGRPFVRFGKDFDIEVERYTPEPPEKPYATGPLHGFKIRMYASAHRVPNG